MYSCAIGIQLRCHMHRNPVGLHVLQMVVSRGTGKGPLRRATQCSCASAAHGLAFQALTRNAAPPSHEEPSEDIPVLMDPHTDTAPASPSIPTEHLNTHLNMQFAMIMCWKVMFKRNRAGHDNIPP